MTNPRTYPTTVAQPAEPIKEIFALREMPMLDTTAQIFYLKNRDPENWKDRHYNENVERKEPDELGKITPEEARRVAENVIKAADQNEAAREKLKKPTIQ